MFIVLSSVVFMTINLSFVKTAGAEIRYSGLVQPPRDVILLLDNSQSMKKNDTRLLIKKALKEFI
jgi:hypothetical protein